MSRIIALEVENIKRISCVSITPKPDGSTVIVGGDNAQGKTSLMDAIAMAIGGKYEIPDQPIHQGASKGQIILTTDDLIIERRFTGTGTQLVVKNRADGAKLTSPQTILDSLTSSVSFDPLSFTRMKPDERANKLRALAGLDFTEIDSERKAAYEKRTEVNREAKSQSVRCDGMPRHAGAPAAAVSTDEIFAELDAAQEKNDANQRTRDDVSKAEEMLASGIQDMKNAEAKVSDIERLLAEAKDALKTGQQSAAAIQAEVSKGKAEIEQLQDIDLEPIRAKLKSVSEVNEQVKANTDWKTEQQKLVVLTKAADELSKTIDQIDQKKQQLIQQAKFPIDGLGFNDDGVTFRGLPFAQASGAEQLRVSVAIGFAMQPKLKIALIRDGSLLDKKSLALVAETAEQCGGQCWIEVVGEGEEVQVVLEDGMVKEDRTK